ncbi:hypothetical protein Godav_021652, partial [Gossypium davidsonii]|nr:hypothetical protein [Gossypium davidsonii]
MESMLLFVFLSMLARSRIDFYLSKEMVLIYTHSCKIEVPSGSGPIHNLSRETVPIRARSRKIEVSLGSDLTYNLPKETVPIHTHSHKIEVSFLSCFCFPSIDVTATDIQISLVQQLKERVSMETEFAGLSLEEEEDEILQVQTEAGTDRETKVLRLVGCFLTASIVHFPAMRSTMANLWHPVKGVQIRDLGEKK